MNQAYAWADAVWPTGNFVVLTKRASGTSCTKGASDNFYERNIIPFCMARYAQLETGK